MERISFRLFLCVFSYMFIGICVLVFVGRDRLGPLEITLHHWLMITGFSGLAISFGLMKLGDWLSVRRRKRLFMSRPGVGEDAFARMHGPVASRLRALLSSRLGINMNALQVGDRLVDDLGVDLTTTPEFLDDIIDSFGIKYGADELATCGRTVRNLTTFNDLVSWIAEKQRNQKTSDSLFSGED